MGFASGCPSAPSSTSGLQPWATGPHRPVCAAAAGAGRSIETRTRVVGPSEFERAHDEYRLTLRRRQKTGVRMPGRIDATSWALPSQRLEGSGSLRRGLYTRPQRPMHGSRAPRRGPERGSAEPPGRRPRLPYNDLSVRSGSIRCYWRSTRRCRCWQPTSSRWGCPRGFASQALRFCWVC